MKNCDYEKGRTLDEWFEIWIEIYAKGCIKETTYMEYREKYDRYIRREMGERELGNIKNFHIQKWINGLMEKGMAVKTIRILKSIIQQMLEKAVDNEYIEKNPCGKIKIQKYLPTKTREALTKEEQEIFLKYAMESTYYNLFRIMLLTGIRIGEAIGLEWTDVDFEKKRIEIRRTILYRKGESGKFRIYINEPKTEKGKRKIPICEKAYEILKDMRKNENDGIVFKSKTGGYLKQHNINGRIKEIIKNIRNDNIEIKDFSLHTLRHTFATRCFENGMKMKTVQKILGHSTIEMTMNIYTHVTEKEEDLEIELINDII